METKRENILIYHGSNAVVKEPEIRKARFNKDFYWGFYCTVLQKQAEKWADKNRKSKIVNIYRLSNLEGLRYKKFDEMNDEWLEFIVNCRNGKSHDYEVVEGPMADDTIYNYISDYIDGYITKAAFWELAKFRYPTHQISFHSARSLDRIIFEGSYDLNDRKEI